MKKNSNSEDKPALQINKLSKLLEGYDVGRLSRAKTNWYFGQWQELADLDLNEFENHPDLNIIAALKAAGYQQLNDMDNCKKCIRIARELGCDNQIIARLLLAGLHNSLGRLAALQKNEKKIQAHFTAAVDLKTGGNKKDLKLASHARSVKEISELGLLPQSAKLIGEEFQSLKSLEVRPIDYEATITVLSSEMEIINHQLSLAHKKKQLYSKTNEAEPVTNPNGDVNIDRLKQLSPSQLGQDLWVLEKTGYKREGFFVEFGATNGILLSNTYLLEKEFGWRGVCSEPNPKYHEALFKNRSCLISKDCIAEKTGHEVEFVLANEYGGIKEYAETGMHQQKVESYRKEGRTTFFRTISLNDFLVKYHTPKTIDYLSIDTEGSEYAILSEFPFNDWSIRYLTVEHNFEAQREKIKTLLLGFGYKRIESQWDDWYMKE